MTCWEKVQLRKSCGSVLLCRVTCFIVSHLLPPTCLFTSKNSAPTRLDPVWSVEEPRRERKQQTVADYRTLKEQCRTVLSAKHLYRKWPECRSNTFKYSNESKNCIVFNHIFNINHNNINNVAIVCAKYYWNNILYYSNVLTN